MASYPKVLSSFLCLLVHALNLQSPATALGACYQRNMSHLFFPREVPLKLVKETMRKEVRDKVAGLSFCAVFICRVKD